MSHPVFNRPSLGFFQRSLRKSPFPEPQFTPLLATHFNLDAPTYSRFICVSFARYSNRSCAIFGAIAALFANYSRPLAG
jgi:hypothetical protein